MENQKLHTVLIKDGTIVTATDKYEADIFISGETIQMIGTNLKVTADKVIDAKGKYIFPGGIDCHTHMELPFMGTFSSDDFETGTLAGLYGGTTSIVDFAIQTQGHTLNAALDEWHRKAGGKAVGDYAFHVGVTDFNDKTKLEIKDIVEQRGATSFKVFMAYKGALMVDDVQIAQLMDEAGKYGGIVIAHCEDGDMQDDLVAQHVEAGHTEPKYHPLCHPEISETKASRRFVDIAHRGDHPCYIVHLTCEGALNEVREVAKRNQKVNVETCIQYLVLNDELYERPNFEGSKWVFSPPLRKPKDQEALWAGIRQNLVHTVATDHCPFCMDQKRKGEKDFSKIPNGAPGVENRMELLFSEGVVKKRISLNKFVEASSTNAAKIFGMFPKKGTIAIGSDADLVVFDPEEKHTMSAKTHHMNCDYSAYEGMEVTGKTKTVLLRGTVAIEDGKALIGKGFGKYIHRAPHCAPKKEETL
jgi:dihydropyrimidinase